MQKLLVLLIISDVHKVMSRINNCTDHWKIMKIEELNYHVMVWVLGKLYQ